MLSSSLTEELDIANSRKLLRSVSASSPGSTIRRDSLSDKHTGDGMGYVTNTVGIQSRINKLPIEPLVLPKVRSMNATEQKIPQMEDKISLFKFPSARILVFDEQLGSEDSSSSRSGRLLGHGIFEIYQMHNRKVSYLSCGSVIYPLLPKLKILRVGLNMFILPLLNPERYWQITIGTTDPVVLRDLEVSFGKVCLYRNLYIEPIVATELPPDSTSIEPTEKQIESPAESTTSPEDLDALPIVRESSNYSISSTIACFSLSEKEVASDTLHLDDEEEDGYNFPPITKLGDPLPIQETGSWDSLLDEYEENISQSLIVAETKMEQEDNHFLKVSRESSDHPYTYRSISGVSSSRPSSLYVPESNWMEPDDFFSQHDNDETLVQSTYDQLYHSKIHNGGLFEKRLSSLSPFQSQNVHSKADSPASSKHTPFRNYTDSIYQKRMEPRLLSRSRSMRFGNTYEQRNRGADTTPFSSPSVRLSSYDVYNLISRPGTIDSPGISEEKTPTRSPSFVSRLFKW